ncbi:MAG: ferrous iron transport protein A [Gammaproteobacteria bacterium]|nr:ferrous iron transport protein A [Gammaproteobacteria bacterium]
MTNLTPAFSMPFENHSRSGRFSQPMPNPDPHALSPEAPETWCRLGSLPRGARGVVIAVHEARLAARLAARGLVPGAEFEVLRGGDPMLLKQDESRWALAGPEADLVEVENLAQSRLPSLLRRLFS